MIAAFYDYQWHLVLNPLCEQFQRWKAGEVSLLEIEDAIHKAHKACQKVYGLFTSKRDFLISVIQFNENGFQSAPKKLVSMI